MGFVRALSLSVYPLLDRPSSWQTGWLWLSLRAECVKMQKAQSLGLSFVEGQHILAQQFSNPSQRQLPSQQLYDPLVGSGFSNQDRSSLEREAWDGAKGSRIQDTVPSGPCVFGAQRSGKRLDIFPLCLQRCHFPHYEGIVYHYTEQFASSQDEDPTSLQLAGVEVREETGGLILGSTYYGLLVGNSQCQPQHLN